MQENILSVVGPTTIDGPPVERKQEVEVKMFSRNEKAKNYFWACSISKSTIRNIAKSRRTRNNLALPGITRHYLALLGITRNYLALLGITRHYLALLGNTWNYSALLGITRHYSIIHEKPLII